MIADLKQFVPSKTCLSCDGCCRFQDEKSVWRPSAVGADAQILAGKIAADDRLQTTCTHGEHQCVFFNKKDNTCRIYSTRPFECRLYPFLIRKKDQDLVVSVHLSCPHIQETDGSIELEAYIAYLRKIFATKEIMDFLKNNPSLAGDYSTQQKELRDLF